MTSLPTTPGTVIKHYGMSWELIAPNDPHWVYVSDSGTTTFLPASKAAERFGDDWAVIREPAIRK